MTEAKKIIALAGLTSMLSLGAGLVVVPKALEARDMDLLAPGPDCPVVCQYYPCCAPDDPVEPKIE